MQIQNEKQLLKIQEKQDRRSMEKMAGKVVADTNKLFNFGNELVSFEAMLKSDLQDSLHREIKIEGLIKNEN